MSLSLRILVCSAVGAAAAFMAGCVSVEPPTTVYSAPSGFATDTIVWYGLDFSKAHFVGKGGFTNPKDVKERFFSSWNEVVVAEPKKFDIARFFDAGTVLQDLSTVTERNKLPDPETMVVMAGCPVPTLSLDTLKGMVKDYGGTQTKGVGLVFIVESLNKIDVTARVYVVHFDIGTKEVLSVVKATGKPNGFGLRNYWANSFYKVMQSCALLHPDS